MKSAHGRSASRITRVIAAVLGVSVACITLFSFGSHLAGSEQTTPVTWLNGACLSFVLLWIGATGRIFPRRGAKFSHEPTLMG